jgi:5-methylcytosine-specific restriction endonuclease McrA
MNSLEVGFPGAEFQCGLPAARAHQGLKQALAAVHSAEKNALLWFADILRRKLYRDLGYSSIQTYAAEALGFSPSKTSQFLRLAESLQELPELRSAIARGEVSWTKAREVVRVATPASGKLGSKPGARVAASWRQVTGQGAGAERRRDPAQDPWGRAHPASRGRRAAQPGAAAPPCNISFRLDGIQLARFDALMAQARKRGLKLSREELLLQALAAFIECAPESGCMESGPSRSQFTRVNCRPPEIILYKCKECGGAEVVTSQGRRAVSPSTLARIECDARVQAEGSPNRSTIPPSTRQAVLARDGHRCQIPGCGRTQLLEVHHIRPRREGGSNQPENLVTTCSACHQLLHERGLASPLLSRTEAARPSARDV